MANKEYIINAGRLKSFVNEQHTGYNLCVALLFQVIHLYIDLFPNFNPNLAYLTREESQKAM
jgi:hypothetical protein